MIKHEGTVSVDNEEFRFRVGFCMTDYTANLYVSDGSVSVLVMMNKRDVNVYVRGVSLKNTKQTRIFGISRDGWVSVNIRVLNLLFC